MKREETHLDEWKKFVCPNIALIELNRRIFSVGTVESGVSRKWSSLPSISFMKRPLNFIIIFSQLVMVEKLTWHFVVYKHKFVSFQNHFISSLLWLDIRGSGVLPKGQHSWNISVTKESRVDPKVDLESLMECPFRGIFFARRKIIKTNQPTSKLYL